MQHSLYHSVLRIASLTVAFVLLFESGLLTPATKVLSDNARLYLATAVGINATVTPNELNQLTAELTAQKSALDRREAALSEREIAVGLSAGESSNPLSTFVLSAILFILLVLILLNYTLDYLRQTRTNQSITAP